MFAAESDAVFVDGVDVPLQEIDCVVVLVDLIQCVHSFLVEFLFAVFLFA